MNKSEFRYFSRNVSLKRSFFLIFLSGFLCLTAVISIQTGVWNNRLETARRQYGLWQGMRLDINETDRQILESHELIEQMGTEEIFGPLEIEGVTFTIGQADKEFFELADFHMIQGRLPQTGNETVAESRVLDQLGMSYEPGQTITGRIQGEDRSLVVTGIIDNYSASWMSGEMQPALFIGPGSGLRPVSENRFLRAENPAVMNDLKAAMPLLIRNVHVNEIWEPFSPENTAWSLLMILALLGSGFLILTIFRKWVTDHRQDIQVLKGLGVSGRKIKQDLDRVVFLTAFMAILISLIIGFLASWPVPVILATAAVMTGEVILLSELLGLEIRRIPATENSGERDLPETQRHFRPMKKITSRTLGLRFLASRRRSIISALLTVILLAGALFSTSLSLAETWQLETWLKEKPDFLLSLDPEGVQTFRTNQSLEALKKKLEKDSRFSSITTEFVQMNGWSIPVRNDSLLEQIRRDPSISEESRNTVLYPAGLMPSDKQDRQMVPMISRPDLDVSQTENFDESLWTSGQGVILYAPDLVVENGELWLAEDQADSDEVRREGTYRTGEMIVLEDPFGNEVPTRIAGVLRKAPGNLRFDDLGGMSMAYTLFAAPAFFENPVNRMHLTLANEQEEAGAEVSVSTMAARENVYLKNERAAKRRVLTFLKNEGTLYGVLTAVFLLTLGLAMFILTRKLQVQLSGYEHRLLLGGADLHTARKTAGKVRRLLLIWLLTGTGLTGMAALMIHMFYPVNAVLLSSVMPFLSVNGDPAGIRQLDGQIGLWLLPAVLILTGLLAAAGAGSGKDRNEETEKKL